MKVLKLMVAVVTLIAGLCCLISPAYQGPAVIGLLAFGMLQNLDS